MRVAKLHVRIAMLAVLALSASACQTAQKPASLLPAKAAPALTSTAPVPAAQQTSAKPQPSTPGQRQVPEESAAETRTQGSPIQAPSPTLDSDPVGDLITRVEKDFQA